MKASLAEMPCTGLQAVEIRDGEIQDVSGVGNTCGGFSRGSVCCCSARARRNPASRRRRESLKRRDRGLAHHGAFAFQKLYVAARGWNQDGKPYRIDSVPRATATDHDANGRSGTAALHRPRGARKNLTPVGKRGRRRSRARVNPGIEDSYSPTNSSTQVFDMAFLKIDRTRRSPRAENMAATNFWKVTPRRPVIYVALEPQHE